jgi:SAM-dependent methyltransferase
MIKQLVPHALLEFRRDLLRKKMRKITEGQPVGEVFSRIYENNSWGGVAGEFYSGSGSAGPAADAYCEMVICFIKAHSIKSVVDVGCGDFRIGNRIAPEVDSYTGIDVVPDLVAFNNKNHGHRGVKFLCLDAASDPLPEADLCLIRQVYQHLSNQQVQSALQLLKQFKYVLVTEHFPQVTDSFVANKDKPHGADTRVYDHSAVVLDAPPFCVSPIELVLSVPAPGYLVAPGEMINTYFFKGTAIKSAVN